MFDCETPTFAAYFHILRHHFGFADEPPELCTAPPLASPTRRKVSEKVVKPWDQNRNFPLPNGGNHLPTIGWSAGATPLREKNVVSQCEKNPLSFHEILVL